MVIDLNNKLHLEALAEAAEHLFKTTPSKDQQKNAQLIAKGALELHRLGYEATGWKQFPTQPPLTGNESD